ncbi:MAG: hypothetical protein KGL39_60445, partial [Patescibacteria group bacterium]|nr:hypothetical protein [Patescibacteria group bacterium]
TAAYGGTGDFASWVGQQTSLAADAMVSAVGVSYFTSNMVVLMPGQNNNTAVLQTCLTAPKWVALGNTAPWQRTVIGGTGQKTITGVTVATYLGQYSWPSGDFTTLQAQTDPATTFFNTLTSYPNSGPTFTNVPTGGWNAACVQIVTDNVTLLTSYGNLPIYAYEGGPAFDGSGASGQITFWNTIAVDARWATYYDSLLQQLKAAGLQFQNHYGFAEVNGSGNWGAIQSPYQTQYPVSSSPPKWQALVNFRSGV